MSIAADRTILIVEDQALIAWDIEDNLRAAGYGAIHLAASVASAQAKIRQHQPHVAVLDVHLARNETSMPIADLLSAMNVPFIFLTGRDADELPAKYSAHRLIQKPYAAAELIAAVSKLLNALTKSERPDQFHPMSAVPAHA